MATDRATPAAPCPFCGGAIDPRKLDDVRQVLVDASARTALAHYDCARGRPLCPVHRQCYAGDRCPRCAVRPPPAAL